MFWMLAPWPAVGAGLYVFHSAALAFALYAAVCLLGTWQSGGLKQPWGARLSWRVHLSAALLANAALVGAYLWLGGWALPVEKMRAGLLSVGVTRSSFAWLFPYFLIGNPLVEEVFWRGPLVDNTHAGRAAIRAIFFGAWHSLAVFLFMPAWAAALATLGVMAVGFALGRVAGTTRSLGDAALFHALCADLPLLIILYRAL
jgi:membrane protease YdiL (CAAX protease family)